MSDDESEQMSEAMFTIYVHQITVKYYDYHTLLETDRGVCYSTDNDPSHRYGIEIGKDADTEVERLREHAAAIGALDAVAIEKGVPIERRSNMNPHGLV